MGESNEKTYKCNECGSENRSEPGNCCDRERVEACADCGHGHKDDGTCDCKCGE